MKKGTLVVFGAFLFLVLVSWGVIEWLTIPEPVSRQVFEDLISLPAPVLESRTSIEEALLERRSIREYEDKALTFAQVSQLLWAAQGETHPEGYRTAPSAGALYPLEVYLVVGSVDDLPAGIYKYLPGEHALILELAGDRREALANAALQQASVKEAPASIVITAIFERTTKKYGNRGLRYVYMETGSASQNVYLQAVSLGIGTVFIGAFHEDEVRKALDIAAGEEPVCILPVGIK